MVLSLKTLKASSRGSGAAVPPGQRVYVVGDIHGRADLLGLLHATIQRDAAQSEALDRIVVYLGDYVDRGEEARGVIDLLLAAPLPGFRAIYLEGNHDAVFRDFLERQSGGSHWLRIGGLETVSSYGVTVPQGSKVEAALGTVHAALRRQVPATHWAFLKGLAPYAAIGDYFFVHAGVRPGVPLAEQRQEDMLWIRQLFLDSDADHGKIVVHGHTVTPEPEVRPNRIGIDTGAYATGRLTCLVLEGKTRRFLSTRP